MVENGSGGLIKPSGQLILGHMVACFHMTFQVVHSIEMALTFRALKLFGIGLEGRDVTEMVVMDIKIHMILEMSCRVMGDDDGSILFQLAGCNAHFEATFVQMDLGVRQSRVFFRVFRQALSTTCHERSPSAVVFFDRRLPPVLFVVDGQASEGT